MQTYLETVGVKSLVSNCDGSVEKANKLEKIVNFSMDTLLPLKRNIIVSNEPAWINKRLKRMIRDRQKALAREDITMHISIS